MPWKPEYAATRKAKGRKPPRPLTEEEKVRRAAYMKEYARNHPEKYRRKPEHRAAFNAKRRAMYAASEEFRESVKSKVKEWNAANPTKRKGARIAKYGLSMAQFDAMMAAQMMACAVCGYSDTTDPNYFPLVDHCHSTGKVRGLLCMNCNQGLGKFKDSPQRLAAAIAYLSRS